MNQWVFQKFEEWLNSMPKRGLKNLEYDRFAKFANIDESMANEYFKLLNKNKVVIAKIQTECPNCNAECSIDTSLYEDEFECSECEEDFNYNNYKKNSTVTYKISEEFMMERSKRVTSLLDGEDNIINISSIRGIKPIGGTDKESEVIPEKKEIKIFFSYSHKDRGMRDELEKHLVMLKRKKLISTWHDKEISAGSELDKEIDENLLTADIILLLISIDFLASDYCYDIEMEKALEMHKSGQAVVIPIILRECDWSDTAFQELKLKALPLDGRSVELWESKDSAFLNIEQGIKDVVSKIVKNN